MQLPHVFIAFLAREVRFPYGFIAFSLFIFLGGPRWLPRTIFCDFGRPFGASWARVWIPRPVLTPLGHDLGSNNDPKTVPKSSKTDFEKVSNLVFILETIFWDTWLIFWSDVWPGSLAICVAPLVHWCRTIFLSKNANCWFYCNFDTKRMSQAIPSRSNPIKSSPHLISVQ